MSLDIPYWLASTAIVSITAVELYLGVILVLRINLKYGLFGATALTFTFAVFLWYLSTLAHPPACGCLGLTGMFESGKKEAIVGLMRNCVILWLLKISYDYYFRAVSGDLAKPMSA